MSTNPEIGEIFSGCEILAHCGCGSFGSTYLARNPLGQQVIIKIITSQYYSKRELAGLRNYMQVSGKHPSLLKIFHIGELDEGFYYIMEAADNCGGETYQPATLGNFLRKQKVFSPDEAIRITRDLLEGVRVIHNANLIHRDIKPDNVIFVNNRAKLSDPGLVIEVGQQVTFAGTLGFIPPEYLEKEQPVNQQADLYAVGKIFYCMVTGCHPSEYPHLPLEMRRDVCRQLFPALSQMCNRNPDKRYKNVDEFLKGLPLQIKNPTRWEQRREEFRSWRILNREKFFRIKVFSAFLLLLLAAGIAWGIWQKFNWHKSVQAAWASVQKFEQINQDRRETVALQLEAELPDKLTYYQNMLQAIKLNGEKNEWHKAAALSKTLHKFLADAARSLIPVLPDRYSDWQKDLTADGLMHSFLLSPLAEYLPAAEKAALKNKLEKLEKKLYANWTGPRHGADWAPMQMFYMPLTFIHAGAVKMQHSGKIEKIPYPFWMSSHEIYASTFSHYTSIVPHNPPHPTMPVTKVAWNDILYFCLIMTKKFKEKEQLPPGYIIRPPTEIEWEFAAKNGYLGKDKTTFEERNSCKSNSPGGVTQAGMRKANKLGLYEMFGNVSEIVHPGKPLIWQDAVLVRGGSFRHNEKQSLNYRINYAKYQFIPDDIGFRLVMAPGTMEYFEKEFFHYCSPSQLHWNGRIYELFGVNFGCYNYKKSQDICRLLGGRLAKIDNLEHLNALKENIPLLGGWNTFIGGENINGKWLWQRDRQQIDFGSWFHNRKPDTQKFLALRGKKWQPVTSVNTSAVFLCEWSQEEYARRDALLKSGKKLPLELKRFSYRNRTFILLNTSSMWYAAQRICRLLGGRIACLDTPELQAEAIRQLEPYSTYNILLGGYAKYNKWFWLSGKELTELPQMKNTYPIPSSNRNFVVLQNGKFYNSQYSTLLLGEFPSPDASNSAR